jgi:ABC-2 type transport system permease protein
LSRASRPALDPAACSESGFFLAQLAIGVLGVLMITGAYASGSIGSTLSAAPQRVTVLAAKATVFTGVAFLTGIPADAAGTLLARRHSAAGRGSGRS